MMQRHLTVNVKQMATSFKFFKYIFYSYTFENLVERMVGVHLVCKQAFDFIPVEILVLYCESNTLNLYIDENLIFKLLFQLHYHCKLFLNTYYTRKTIWTCHNFLL